MGYLTRGAARRQAANAGDGGSRNAQATTVSTTIAVAEGTNDPQVRRIAGGESSIVYGDAAGGVDKQHALAKHEEPEADEASQTNIPKEDKASRTRQSAKARKSSRKSRKGVNRTAKQPRAVQATSTNGGSNENLSATRNGTVCQKRALEDASDVDTDEGPSDSRNATRRVRRKVDETRPNAGIFREATNSNPGGVGNNNYQSNGERLRAPEELPSAEDSEDKDVAPRFTRMDKGKYTEREGIAADALIELRTTIRVLPDEDGARTSNEIHGGENDSRNHGITDDALAEGNEPVERVDLGEVALAIERPTGSLLEVSNSRSTLTEEDRSHIALL